MDIIINALPKQYVNFTPINIGMLRGVLNTVNSVLYYTNGTGQTISAGTILTYTGSGQTVTLTFPNNTVFSGSGNTNVTISSTPTSTATDLTATYMFDSSAITVNVDYNTSPVVNDITISPILNRYRHDFTIQEVESQFSDYDLDSLNAMRVNGNVTGYQYNQGTIGTPNYQPYVAGTWILRADIPKLRFRAPNQDTTTTKTNQWQARDSALNISNSANIVIPSLEFPCSKPIITSATYTGTPYIVQLSWTTVPDYFNESFPDVRTYVLIEIYNVGNSSTVFNGGIQVQTPLNGTNYQLNMSDFAPFNPEYRVTVTVRIVSELCDEESFHVFPPNTLN